MTAKEYSERAEKYYKKKKYSKVIVDLTKVIELEPDNPFAHCKRGMAYRNKKKFDLAITDFTEAIRLKPEDGSFYFERGDVYAFQENKDHVIADFEKFLELSPNDEKAEDIRGFLEGLKSGKIAFFKGRIVDIDEELRKRSILIIIFNIIPIIPILRSFVWVWYGFGGDPVGLKDDFMYIKYKETYTLGDDIPVLGFILDIPKYIADIPKESFYRACLRFLYVFFRLMYFWALILAALIFASPIVGIVRGITFLVERGKLKKLAVQG
jgi:tetratricopeptide (TPR) repeat protein